MKGDAQMSRKPFDVYSLTTGHHVASFSNRQDYRSCTQFPAGTYEVHLNGRVIERFVRSITSEKSPATFTAEVA